MVTYLNETQKERKRDGKQLIFNNAYTGLVMYFLSPGIWFYQSIRGKHFGDVYDTCGIFCLFCCISVCGIADEDFSSSVVHFEYCLDVFTGRHGSGVSAD